jgi:hypothetical protein
MLFLNIFHGNMNNLINILNINVNHIKKNFKNIFKNIFIKYKSQKM